MPIDSNVERLLKTWDLFPRYDKRKIMGEWIVNSTDMEFKDGAIIGSNFDQKHFTKLCEKELKRFFHSMAVRIQALVRGVLSREAQRRIPVEYDRSFYTKSAIARMRPKFAHTRPPTEAEFNDSHDNKIRSSSPPRSYGSPNRPPGRNILTAPNGVSPSRFGGGAAILLDHDWLGLDAPRSVTAGDSPRLNKSQKLHMKQARPKDHPQWPKRSPRSVSAKKTSRQSTGTANKPRTANKQERLQDVMALYIPSSRPFYQNKQHDRHPESTIYSYKDQLYDELQSLQLIEIEHTAHESHFPHVTAAGDASVTMEYVSLFSSKLGAHVYPQQSHGGSVSKNSGDVEVFGSLRYYDSVSVEDKSVMTEHSVEYRRGDELEDASVAASVGPTEYCFRNSEVIGGEEDSLWNGSVTDNMYLPTETSRFGHKGEISTHSRIKPSSTAQKQKDPNYLHPGDYKLLVDYRDAKQRRGWMCILRALSAFVHRFQWKKFRSKLLCQMSVAVDAVVIQDGLQFGVLHGDVELVTCTMRRIQSIIQSHAKGQTVIVSTFNPTSLGNLSLVVDTLHAFISVEEMAAIAVDIMTKLSSVSNIGDLPEMMGSAGILGLIVAMWTRYSSNCKEDETRTVLLIKIAKKLTTDSSKNMCSLFSVTNCNILANLIMKYMRTNLEMLERFLRLHCKLGAKDRKIMDNYSQSKLYRSLVNGIKEHSSNCPVLHLLSKCATLLCGTGHVPTQTYFGSMELCRLYTELLRSNTSDFTTYRHVVSLVISVGSKNPSSMANLADSDISHVLMEIVSDDSLDPEVLQCSITLLFHLSSHEPLKDGLIAMGLDALLRDVGMKYDLKRTIGALGVGRPQTKENDCAVVVVEPYEEVETNSREQFEKEFANKIIVSTAAHVTVGSILRAASASPCVSPTGDMESRFFSSIVDTSSLVHQVQDFDTSILEQREKQFTEDSKESEMVRGGTLLNPCASGAGELFTGGEKVESDVEEEDDSGVDGEYILECLDRSVILENEDLAIKTLHSVYGVIIRCRDGKYSKNERLVVTELLRSPTLLLRVLHTFLKSVSVQNMGVWILRNIFYEEPDVIKFCEAGVCDIVYSQLQEYVYNDEIFSQVIDYAAFMSSQYGKFCSVAGSMGYCKVLMSTMSRIVVSNWQLMSACCMYARILAIEHVDNLCRSGVVGHILKFLIAHKKEIEIVHICGETILALTELDSDAVMTCLGSHKHLRLYVHIIKANYQSPRVANVMSNVLVSLCGHRNGETIAAEIEKSGIVVDLVNVLRRAISSRSSDAARVLHTTLLLIVHMTCHVHTFETIFVYADGKALLRGLMNYEDEDVDRSNSIRDIALAGYEHISTPSTLSRRPGISLQVLLDGDRIYSYSSNSHEHVSTTDSIHYDIDHGPYPGQPAIEPPPPLNRSDPEHEVSSTLSQKQSKEDISSVGVGQTHEASPQADALPQEEPVAAADDNDKADTNTYIESTVPQNPIQDGNILCVDQEDVEEARDMVSPIPEGMLRGLHSRDSPSPTGSSGSSSPTAMSPKVLRTLSGNSLLRVLKTVSDSEFIVDKLKEACTAKDRVLGLNALNRTLQLISTSANGDAFGTDASLRTVLSGNLSILLNFVEAMPSDADVLLVVAAVLFKLPISSSSAETHMCDGIFHMVYSVLQNHISDADTFVSWSKVATKLVKLSKSHRHIAGRNQGCQIIYSLLQASIGDSKKVGGLLGLIAAMCVECPKNQGLFARTGIGSTVVKYLIDNKKEVEIVKKSIKVIDGLCSGNIELNLRVMASQRHIRLYIHVLKNNQNDTLVVQTICALLMNLSSGNSDFVNSELDVGQDKIVADLVSVLQDAGGSLHEDSRLDDDRLQALLAVFSHWATNIRVLRAALVQSLDFVTALQMFTRPPWNNSTAQIASELILYFEAFH